MIVVIATGVGAVNVGVIGQGSIAFAAKPTETQEPVSFASDVEPIFKRNCYGCHQGAKQLGSYRMTDFASLIQGGESGDAAIVPGNPDDSYLIDQITPVDGHAEMPDEPFPALSEIEVELIARWVKEGAVDDRTEEHSTNFDNDHPPTYQSAPTIPAIDVSPDGSWIAVAGHHEILLFDRVAATKDAAGNNENPVVASRRMIGMSSRINDVQFSPDGMRLAACGGNPGQRGELQVWDVTSGELLVSQAVTYDTLSGLAWSPDGSKIAFGATDNVIRAVDSETGQQVLSQGAHDDWVLDTAFTADGKHLVSVARDMSCKLTEVETERFVDNITSITPGALSGGLSSVQTHPSRDEIVIGGADGIAKVYRVFRKTERKIGDDANLVRVLPALDGRIFSVAISPDASRIAAAATIDGKSEVQVWKYDFDGTLTKQDEEILKKRVSDRKPDEKARIEKSRNQATEVLTKIRIESAAVYAIALTPDNELVIAADDGKLRIFDQTGKKTAEFSVIQISPADTENETPLNIAGWSQRQIEAVESVNANESDDATGSAKESAIDVAGIDLAAVVELDVTPSDVTLDSAFRYAQLIVTAKLADGTVVDATRAATYQHSDAWKVTQRGRLIVGDAPLTKPETITIKLGKQQTELTANRLTPSGDSHHFDFIQDVNPVLSRLGCNQGTCHGAQKGKNGFRLSLRGYDPKFDLRALTDDLASRRIDPTAPEKSLMLEKPLGNVPHQGGVLMTKGDPYHAILKGWIAAGASLEMKSAKVSELQIYPTNPQIQTIGNQQQVRVVATYADGSKRDVTAESFIESGNTEVAAIDSLGLLTSIRRGESAVLARYEGAYAATTLTVMGDRSGYEKSTVDAWSPIDELVAQKWERMKITPSDLCDDATYLRRVHLDLTGLPPTSDEVREFLADDSETKSKRARVVDQLIGSEAYVDYWTNKWADLLQVNRKFLGVPGSQKFRDWIRAAIASNMPYDQFANQILTASGSNHDNPPASYFKTLRTPEDTMENTTHLFLGIRFNCNKCHDHPFERWTQDQYYEMASFFARVGFVHDPKSGNAKIAGTAVEGAKSLYEKVIDRDQGDVMHPQTGDAVEPAFPVAVDGVAAEAKDGTRREHLARWITHPDNPYFARSYVNRVWGYLLGVGLIEPIDDIRAGNPPTNPELLDHLTQTFVETDFDVAMLLRRICNSRTYQLSVDTQTLNEDDNLNYSHALPRRLPAEVIYDAIHEITGSVNKIPGVPDGTRAAALSDSGVKLPDGFLQNLGRPVRESACECERSTDLQLGPVMALISGPTVGTAIADAKNELNQIVKQTTDDVAIAEEIFLRALGRKPSQEEFAAFASMQQAIEEDHQKLSQKLINAEAMWKSKRPRLEERREADLVAIKEAIKQHQINVKPQRDLLAEERKKKIADAQAALDAATKKLSGKEADRIAKQASTTEWHPLTLASATGSKEMTIVGQPDRSILASGKPSKQTYNLKFKTSLPEIRGLRLETLVDETLPAQGPGLAGNGNFVITEIEVFAKKSGTKEAPQKIKIASGVADFTQSGFAIAQTFNGQTRNQRGWAIAGATSMNHWAVFTLDKPIQLDGKIDLEIRLHQFHNATDHRLGRFRISVTSDEGKLPLGLDENLAAIHATPAARRSDAQKQAIVKHVTAVDPGLVKLRAARGIANQPIPVDKELVRLQRRQKELEIPTPDDPALVSLRNDFAQSKQQIENERLTAAQDLVWALFNSPSFLFNR